MALFLKVLSGIYLGLVWLIFATIAFGPSVGLLLVGFEDYYSSYSMAAIQITCILLAVGLSLPAAVLFGFAQIVGDVRIMRINAGLQSDHLAAIRGYYER
jgi:hypothetical protein